MKIYSFLSSLYEAIEKREIPFKEVSLEIGEELFQNSTIKDDDVLLVLSGTLRLIRSGDLGESFVEAGEMLGDVAAFTGRARSAKLKAVKPCMVACFNKHDFVKLLAKPNTHGEYSCLTSYLEFMADRLIRTEEVFKDKLTFVKSNRLRNAS